MHDFPVHTAEQLTPLLTAFRKRLGLSQAELAHRLGVGQQTVSQLERNPQAVSVERLLRLLAQLDVDHDYFENLLPDTKSIRERLARRFSLGALDAFSLLTVLGRDCVGALQITPADATPPDVRTIDAQPLDESDIARLLRASQKRLGRWRRDHRRPRGAHARVEAQLPAGFPARVAEPVFAGLLQAAKKLAGGGFAPDPAFPG